MAIQIIREVNADVVKKGVTKTVYAKQYDVNSRFLNVRIQEDGKDIVVSQGLTVMLNVKRPDEAENIFYGTVNSDGSVKVPLAAWMLKLSGTLVCDISIVSEDPAVAKLTTMQFSIYVEAAAVADSNKTDTEEYSVIVDLLNRVEALENGGGGGSSTPGEDGATFTPSVSAEGVISWTNDKGLENPTPVNIKGGDGNDGTNYVLTDADRTQIANIVATQLGGQPVYGIVGDSKVVTLHGNVAFDEYTFGYMENGEFVKIGKGEYEPDTPDVPVRADYTNLFNPANATINKRASISSGYSNCDGAVVSEFINISDKMPVSGDFKLYLEGATFDVLSASNNYPRAIFYTSKPSSGFENSYSAVYTNALTPVDEGNGVKSYVIPANNTTDNVKYMVVVLKVSDTAITTDDIQDIVVTWNEPIYK